MSNADDGEFIKPTMIMFITTVGAGACDYIYQIAMGRSLGVESYSELTALLSILMMVSIPPMAIQIVLARYIARLKTEGRDGEASWMVRRAFAIVLIVALVCAAAVMLMIPLIEYYLAISSFEVICILSCAVALRVVLPAGMGVAQGVEEYWSLGLQQMMGAVVKVVSAVALVLLGFQVGGALCAVLLGSLVSVLIALVPSHQVWKSPPVRLTKEGVWMYAVPSMIGVLAIGVMTNVDILAARIYLDNYEAGLFSAASMLSKVVLFLPSAISAVMLPKLAKAMAKGTSKRDVTIKSFGLAILLCSSAALAFFFIPDDILGLFYGEQYVDAADTLKIMGFAMMFYSLANLFNTYAMGAERYLIIWILGVFTIIQVILIGLFTTTADQLAMIMLVSSLCICATSALYLMTVNR